MFEAEQKYWNDRYANHDPRGSGGGSYGEAMWRRAEVLAALPGVKSIVEIGCGDFNFGKHLTDRLPTVKYDGYDISDVVIDRNAARFETSSPRVEFHHYGRGISEAIAKPDLLLCVDVLFHIISSDEYQGTLIMLERMWTKYLAVTAYEYDGQRLGHIHIRKFHPLRFGVPILQETTEEDGDMQLYIFKK